MIKQLLNIEQACSFEIEFQAKDKLGEPIDLTGVTLVGRIKKAYGSPESIAKSFAISVPTGIDGWFSIVLDSNDTNMEPGTYVWDVIGEEGSANVINKYAGGQAIIYPSVTIPIDEY